MRGTPISPINTSSLNRPSQKAYFVKILLPIIPFKLKEAYSFSDIIAENLSTHSGDKLLQTGGMFYAEAVYNGQSVNLKKALNVSFASKESKLEGMQLFTGTRDPQRNGRMDWQPIKDPSVSAAFFFYAQKR